MSKKTKITLFIPSLRGGGAERVFVILANAFSDKGYKVHLVLVSAIGPYLDNVSDNVEVINLKCSRSASSLFALVRYLKIEKPDVLLSAMGHTNVVALLARKISRVSTKIVISERSYFSVSQKFSYSWKMKVLGFFIRKMYTTADGIIAISAGVADDISFFSNVKRDKVDVIYNPVDIRKVQELSFEKLDETLLNKKGKPLILAAGRFVEIKNFSTLIKAFSKYREKNEGVLCIIGDGPLRNQLREEAENLGIGDDVMMPGFINNPFPLMRHADVFVLSSIAEAFGNVLVEAMACGTPVVSTDCPSGPSEILENGFWGKLVPVGNDLALSNAILSSLSSTDHPDIISRAYYFSVEKAVDSYLKVMFSEK